jgi:hypothetical protein
MKANHAMKHHLQRLFIAAALGAASSLPLQAAPSEGFVDFGKFTAAAQAGDFVEVNVTSNLISLASKLVEKQQADAAKLLRSVEAVRVIVVGLSETNRAEVEAHVKRIRQELNGKGWEQIVVAAKKQGEDVGVFLKTRGDEAVAGIAVTALDPKKGAVLINVVGNIRPEQIAAVGEALNIDPLKEAGASLKK